MATKTIAIRKRPLNIIYDTEDLPMSTWFGAEQRKMEVQSEAYVQVNRLHQDTKMPTKVVTSLVGWQIHCPSTVRVFNTLKVYTGIQLIIPEGMYAEIKNAMIHRTGLYCVNTTVHQSYRGEIIVELVNNTADPVLVKEGEVIAQLVFYRTVNVTLRE